MSDTLSVDALSSRCFRIIRRTNSSMEIPASFASAFSQDFSPSFSPRTVIAKLIGAPPVGSEDKC